MAIIARQWEDDLEIQRWWCDPEGGRKAKNESIDRWRGKIRGSIAVNSHVKPANNELAAGRDSLRNCLRLQSKIRNPGNPGHPASWLYVSSDCEGDDSLAEDLQILQYAEVAEGEEIDERKVKPKRSTHRPDALRYAVHSELATSVMRTSWQNF
jgi:hypothetical protein